MQIEKIVCAAKSELEELRAGSALTVVGLSDDDASLSMFAGWLESHGSKLKTPRMYIVSGELMDSSYGLTGRNAYPPDLNIVCVKLDDLENYEAIVVPRFEIRGRWFDDVVDNDLRRQSAQEES